jgi:hypothetical protein
MNLQGENGERRICGRRTRTEQVQRPELLAPAGGRAAPEGVPDPELVGRVKRRSFTAECKARILAKADADRTALTRIRRDGPAQRDWSQLTGGRVPLDAPYLDGPVVRTVLRISAPERAIPYKALVCVAMADMPSWQPSRNSANYIAEFDLGFRHAEPALLALMDNSRLADLGVIAPAPLCDAIRDAVATACRALTRYSPGSCGCGDCRSSRSRTERGAPLRGCSFRPGANPLPAAS